METKILKVSGMTCGGCTANVTRALQDVRGVGKVEVSLPKGEATVQFDEQLVSSEQLKSAVQHAGYGVDGPKPAHSQQQKGGCC